MLNKFVPGIIGAWRITLLTPYVCLIKTLLKEYITKVSRGDAPASDGMFRDAQRLLALLDSLKR